MSHIIYKCKECPFLKTEDDKPVCDRIWPAKSVEDTEKQPGWCPLSEDDPMST